MKTCCERVYKSTDDYQIPGHIENLAIRNLLYIQRGFSPHFTLVTLGDINYSKTIGIYAKKFRVAYTQEAAMFRVNDKGLYEFFFKISGQNYTPKGFN